MNVIRHQEPGLRKSTHATSVFRVSYSVRMRASLLAALVVGFCSIPKVHGQSGQKSGGVQSVLPAGSEPVGAKRCIVCHPSEVAGYEKTTMAHSLRAAGLEPDGTVTANGPTITMTSSPAGYFQHWTNGGDKLDFRIDWVIGSGAHASGYLVDIGNHLFQSPVAYYKSRGAYDLAPGFEHQADPDFTRPIRQECLLCHSGTSLFVPGTLNEYRPPIFPAAAESITCERCHGPSDLHIADPRPGTIINPANLEPAARDSVCEQCHLFGAARVPNPGRQISDFVPGERTEDIFTTFHDANPAGSFKVISHAEQLALSACARNSQGRLWCGTCHNPHEKPADSVSYYRARCLTCHATTFPATPHPAQDTNCLTCHMPRRDAKDGGHTVFTDHRIQRRPQEYPEVPSDSGLVAWREPATPLETRNMGIAYIDAGMQRHSGAYILQGYRMLTSVQQQFPDDSELFKWIGQALLIGKQSSEARFAFERALELDPNSALAEGDAASPYILAGDDAGAIAHLEKALALDSLDLPAASKLIALYQKTGRDADADALSGKIKDAMSASSAASSAGATGHHAASGETRQPTRTAEAAYKNIQVLKGIPADQLIPSMQFMVSSLGVECSYCHVEGHFEKDDKKAKQTARAMMKMMFALNGKNFAGEREITCYSCHRGAPDPVATPTLSTAPATAANLESVASAVAVQPTAEEIVDSYIAALGGRAGIEQVRARVSRGNETSNGTSVPIEILTAAGTRSAMVRHLKEGDASTVIDGNYGWTTAPGRPARAMDPADLTAASIDADLQFPVHLIERFPDLRVERGAEIDGYPAFVVTADGPAALRMTLFFDRDTRLLVRAIRYGASPLGRNPTQIDYSDYRDVGGVRVPFRVITTVPNGTSVVQLDEIHENAAMDEAIFARPSSLATTEKPITTGRKH